MADVLAFGAHPDDVEIAMGGTVAHLVRQGHQVGIVDLSDGEPTPLGSREIRAKEAETARSTLGAAFRITLGLRNRAIFDTEEARKEAAAVIRQHKPKYLFAHHWEDYHPDHLEASRLVLAAKFYAKFVKTDMPGEPHVARHLFFFSPLHLRCVTKPSFIVGLEEQDMEIKQAALRAYDSQFRHKPDLFGRVRDFNVYWGLLVQSAYGEPFYCKEEIGLRDIGSLL